MWYIVAKSDHSGLHIIACPREIVNDLQYFYKKLSICNKKIRRQIDRFYQTNKDRSKNYTYFEIERSVIRLRALLLSKNALCLAT